MPRIPDLPEVTTVTSPDEFILYDLETDTTKRISAANLFAMLQLADTDLTTISGLTPTNDDVLQYKAGAWANRTLAQLKTDLAITGGGDTSTNTSTSVDGESVLFSGTGGKTLKRSTLTGIIKQTSGVSAAAVAGTDYAAPTSGSAVLKGNGAGGFSAAVAGTDYVAPTGSGAALTGITESQVANLVTDLAAKAPLASPALTGTPTAPTAGAGTNSTQIATTAYADTAVAAALQGIRAKAGVRVATTANGTLATAYANGQTVDGVTLVTGDRILLKNQTTATDNGVYTVNASGVPTRATDADAGSEVKGLFVFVEEGTANADTGWLCTNDGTITLGSTSLTFVQFASAGQVSAGNGITKTGLVLSIDTSITVDKTTAQVLTNKDLSSGTNTFPTLNQNTTGSAATLTTPRTIAGVSFNGSANIAIASTNLSDTASIALLTNTVTLTNKRITKRTGTTASSATPTINTDNIDFYSITALAAAITSFTTNLTGTPTDGQVLWIAITDNGTARAITWGATFEASGNVALPTTTVISTRLDVGFVWNAATSKWRCVAVA